MDLRSDLQLLIIEPSKFLSRVLQDDFSRLDKNLYGRDREIEQIKLTYHLTHNGVMIRGKVGVGKSKTAMHVLQEATKHVIIAEYDEGNPTPLSTITSLFNSLCDKLVEEATPTQLHMASVHQSLCTMKR